MPLASVSPLTMGRRAAFALRDSIADGTRISLALFRIIIPIIVGIKVLTELGLVKYVALPLQPIMTLMGLPPEFGLAWAASMLVNLYSGLMIFLSILPTVPPPTVAQMTVFAVLMLIAHSLIVEGRIASQCGVSMWMQIFLRLVIGIFAGWLFHVVCTSTGWLSEPAKILLMPTNEEPGWLAWLGREGYNLAKIFFIVCTVMLLQRIIDALRISALLGYVLSPVLRLVGLSPQVATTIVVAFCMGLIYGSGIIIKKTQEGTLSDHDVFCAITLMGLSHALIEDTLLMMLMGSSLWGLLFWRLSLTLGVGIVLNIVYTMIMQRRKI